jgi:hypothetical protein
MNNIQNIEVFYEYVFENCHWEKDLDHCFQQGKDRSLR